MVAPRQGWFIAIPPWGQGQGSVPRYSSYRSEPEPVMEVGLQVVVVSWAVTDQSCWNPGSRTQAIESQFWK